MTTDLPKTLLHHQRSISSISPPYLSLLIPLLLTLPRVLHDLVYSYTVADDPP
jgi:hypothetical protein